ncbi:MAG: NAD(P)H-quinone oxidoreductase [Gammaproteobacteria bacterium]|nr:NAD(P)H-quinone oxidoreductase [Gammaproteobacteria bacterium]
MRAVIIDAFGGPQRLTVGHREMPQPGDGEVRVRVAAAGLNRADLLQRRGVYLPPNPYDPMLPGLEYAGVVDAVGSRVDRPGLGDRVMGLVPGGAQAEHVVVPAVETIPVPANLDLVAAAGVPEAFLTAFDALYLQGSLGEHQTCLVRGASSGVGIAGCQLARSFGNPCIGTTRSEAKRDRLQEMGVSHALMDSADLADRVMEITEGVGVPVVMDLVGGAALDSNIGMVAQRGVVVCVGLLAGTESTVNLMTLLARRVHVVGTVMRSRAAPERARLAGVFQQRVLPMFTAGILHPVIAHTFALADVAAAHEVMEQDRHFGKLVLRVAGPD